MKYYFAGSIRGGRDDAALYKEIVEHLKLSGVVLTEHVADINLSDTGEEISEAEIFERDLKWVEESDALIAEITTPSLGVGYEIARAEAFGKPILCLYQPKPGKKSPSAMITGCSNVKDYPYTELEEAKKIIDEFLKGI